MTWLSYNNIINNRLDLLIIIITIIRRADKFKRKIILINKCLRITCLLCSETTGNVNHQNDTHYPAGISDFILMNGHALCKLIQSEKIDKVLK